jgi:hypothetical protein
LRNPLSQEHAVSDYHVVTFLGDTFENCCGLAIQKTCLKRKHYDERRGTIIHSNLAETSEKEHFYQIHRISSK